VENLVTHTQKNTHYPIIGVKEETIIEVELTQVQRTIYKMLYDDNRATLLQNLKSRVSYYDHSIIL
jgi:SNF2 family DNA or RNA helicase